MANHDYAAGIDPRRRLSLWAQITRSLNLKTDWDSAPPLTAGLRNRFPNLLQTSVASDKPLFPDILRPGYRVTASPGQQYTQPDSSHGVEANKTNQNDSRRPIIHGGVRYERSTSRRPSRRVHPQPTPNQHRIREPHSTSANPFRARVQNATQDADMNVDPRRAPVAPSQTISPHPHRQTNPSRGVHPAQPSISRLPSSRHGQPSPHMHTIRRVPVQSSLRNQVHHDTERHTESRRVNSTPASARSRVAPPIPQRVVCSQFPIYTPLPSTEPHTLPPPHPHFSPTARNTSTHPPQHPTTSSLSSHPQPTHHASLTDPHFQPPFSHIPSSSSHAVQSATSLATFENPDVHARPPLSRHAANFEGLKQKLGLVGWGARTAGFLGRVKRGILGVMGE